MKLEGGMLEHKHSSLWLNEPRRKRELMAPPSVHRVHGRQRPLQSWGSSRTHSSVSVVGTIFAGHVGLFGAKLRGASVSLNINRFMAIKKKCIKYHVGTISSGMEKYPNVTYTECCSTIGRVKMKKKTQFPLQPTSRSVDGLFNYTSWSGCYQQMLADVEHECMVAQRALIDTWNQNFIKLNTA